MKRTINFILCVSLVILLIPINITKAAENDYGILVETKTYEDIDGSTVIEKIYFKPDTKDGTSVCDTSGKGWYTNEKTHTWEDGSVMTYFAQGYFVWGNGDVNVEDKTGGVSGQSGYINISNKKLESGKGKYGLVFNNYAYVTFSFTATNPAGISQNFSVTVRISESGNNI